MAATASPTRPERLLIGCPPDEEHTLGPLLLSLLLRRQGREVIYLGANVPLARLETTVAAIKPQLIILSAQRLPTAATLQKMAFLVEHQTVSLAFGGQIFNDLPGLRQRIPGHFLGKNLNEAPQVIEQLLLSTDISTPTITPISETYQQALAHYSNLQTSIEALVWETLQDSGIFEHHLSVAGYNFSLNIVPALTLGDMDFLRNEVAWATHLLVNHQLPPSLLCIYFEAYLKATEEKLDERGAPVIAWLAQVVSNCDQMVLEAAQ